MPRRAEDSRAASKESGEREVPLEGTGRIVIVAEKAKALRRKVRDALERYGYTVFEAKDGVQALHLSRNFDSPADLLLADAELTKLSGRELVDEMALAGTLPKVMFLSGPGERAWREDAGNAGNAGNVGNAKRDYPSVAVPCAPEHLARRVGEELSDWE
jgi:CheY-like chemotaxis protein